MSKEYKRVFERQSEIDALYLQRKELRDKAQALWSEVWEREQKARRPKRSRKDVELPDELIEQLRAEVLGKFPELQELDARIEQTRKEREEFLSREADGLKLKPDPKMPWRVADECHTSTYSSQTCPWSYAYASLLPLAWKLETTGFKCHIKKVIVYSGRDVCNHFYDGGRMELWSNAEAWQVDAAKRQLTIAESLMAMGRIVNPKVVYTNLFLDRLYDWHYANSGEQYTLKTEEKP